MQAYRNGGDFESVIRLYLGPLGKAEEAADLARHSGKPSVLAMVARERLKAGNPQVLPGSAWWRRGNVGTGVACQRLLDISTAASHGPAETARVCLAKGGRADFVWPAVFEGGHTPPHFMPG